MTHNSIAPYFSAIKQRKLQMTHKLYSQALLLFCFFIFTITLGCSNTQDGETVPPATSTPVDTVKPLTITGGEEILVAEDISNHNPFWCSNDEILIYVVRYGSIFYYDTRKKKSFRIADHGNAPLACSPDGKWLVYMDRLNMRYHTEPTTDFAADLWRYEFKTGKKQKFTITTSSIEGSSLFKPDKSYTLFLGKRTHEQMEMPEPKWKILWSRQKESFSGFWLKDNSAIIGDYQTADTRENSINIEPIDITKEIISLYPKYPNYYFFMLDTKDRVYIKASGIMRTDNSHTVRCRLNLKDKDLSCEPILFDKFTIHSFDILSDNETIVFNRYGEDCLKIKRIGWDAEKCITSRPHKMGFYAVASPNDRWVAFTSNHFSTEYRINISDLHIIELKTK